MSQTDDAQVIQLALSAHLQYLTTAEQVHRWAATAIADQVGDREEAPTQIALTAAHRARCASFAQRREFLEQLAAFPVTGLRALTDHDMRALQVPAHIGTGALPAAVAERMAAREARSRSDAARAGARSASQGSGAQGVTDVETGTGPASPRDRSFNDILYGQQQ